MFTKVMARVAIGSVSALALATPMVANATPSSPSSDDLAPLYGAQSKSAIPGKYIVVLKDDAGIAARNSVSSLAADVGATVRERYDSALTGFSASMSESAVEELRADPRVAYVQANQEVHATGTQTPTPSWGLDRVDQEALPADDSYTYAETGAGVTAYIIDTGINATHQDFGDRVGEGFSAVDGGTDDANGHGTHVAGTVGGTEYGLAKDVALEPVRVLDANGSGSTEGVVKGIDWVTENASGPSVANMSLGGPSDPALDDAVAGSIEAGVTYAVAAGNDYGADACGSSPAAVPEALTVASTADDDAASEFTNGGSCVDLAAPGTDITSDWIGGDDATNTISGTSMATPHVTGVAALYLEANPDADPAGVSTGLVDEATPDVITGLPEGTANLLLNYPQDF
ncbi:S8 family peptidase [Solicola gregarius]|uniref:S8 family peptidase n=1 Tax=Solicola gregarius TaxID=2908642 RepID=A0AA46YN56_9ACTN|nr:S8 family peptidase [Solicola gregarius]UYM07136.1 S8 family peptidase [Solicola gregarius]